MKVEASQTLEGGKRMNETVEPVSGEHRVEGLAGKGKREMEE